MAPNGLEKNPSAPKEPCNATAKLETSKHRDPGAKEAN